MYRNSHLFYLLPILLDNFFHSHGANIFNGNEASSEDPEESFLKDYTENKDQIAEFVKTMQTKQLADFCFNALKTAGKVENPSVDGNKVMFEDFDSIHGGKLVSNYFASSEGLLVFPKTCSLRETANSSVYIEFSTTPSKFYLLDKDPRNVFTFKETVEMGNSVTAN